MSGIKNRKRNQMISFRASLQEKQVIEARVKVSGMPKGEYYRKSLLSQKVEINAGKYQSDRLSIEIRRLREQIEQIPKEHLEGLLEEIKALLEQLDVILNDNFITKK